MSTVAEKVVHVRKMLGTVEALAEILASTADMPDGPDRDRCRKHAIREINARLDASAVYLQRARKGVKALGVQ